MNLPQAFIFIGRSGSGKGTQVKLLLEYLKKVDPTHSMLYVETGSLFRQFLALDGYSSQHTKEKNLAGERGADFMAIYLWSDFLIKNFDTKQTLMFDGSPRSLTEALAMETALKFYGFAKAKVIYLDVTPVCATERLEKRGRSDDVAPGGIAKRLGWFEESVIPAINYYKKSDYYEFVDINGDQETEKVHQNIVARLWLNLNQSPK